MSKPSFLFVLACLIIAISPAISQKVITTDSGKKIVINADGTWSDYEGATEQSTNEKIKPIKDLAIEAQMSFDSSEQEDYQQLRSLILKKHEELKSQQFKNKNNISVVKDEIKRAKKDKRDDLFLKRLEERKLQYYLAEYDIEKELDIVKPLKLSIDRIDGQGFNSELYKHLKQSYIAYAGDGYQQTSDVSDIAQNSVVQSAETKEMPNEAVNVTPTPPQFTEAELKARDVQRELAFYTFDTDNNDVLRNPPELKCKVKLKGIDKRTRKERTELESGFLFGYTHPNIKSYFKENDYLTCNAKLSKVGGLYYLSFEIRIASIKANKSYGALDKGSPIRIKLLDGETVNLYNISAATGIIEPLTGVTVYQTNYPLEKAEFKQLSKTEIDKIGVIWSTGYEEYEIYEVDFLMNQAECLKNS